ncbi:hypothetical protein ACFL2G_03865 [Candidatus Omnitrophota bacterium]
MPLLIVVSTCIIIGIVAQKVKQRTGAFWGFFTFIAILPMWLFLQVALPVASPEMYIGKAGQLMYISIAVIVSIVVGIVMFLIILTLPNKSKTVDKTKKCPYCAETVKIEAKICKHCDKELPVITK